MHNGFEISVKNDDGQEKDIGTYHDGLNKKDDDELKGLIDSHLSADPYSKRAILTE